MKRLIVLRPEPGASATVARARELGLEAMAIPLFEVEPVAWEAPDPASFDALLLTSANTIRHGGSQLESFRTLPVHAVGAATADAARDAGFAVASSGNAGADELLDSLAPGLRLLHLCGEDRKAPTTPHATIQAIPVYRARAIDPPPVLDRAKNSVVLVHSPHAGRRFAELVDERGAITVAAIRVAAAAAVGSGWGEIAVAMEPSDDALLALAARLCNTSPPK